MARFPFFRPQGHTDMMHLKQMRECIQTCREVLDANPLPSTFVGRKTQGPVRTEEAAGERGSFQIIVKAEQDPPNDE